LSGSGEEERHILSHDQIEAALMRSAGYHVRVMPREDLGWEESPPTLLEFMRRDLRWCQGNMQYWRFLLLPNLRPVSRYQLVLAILMFIGSPAWIGLLALATIALVRCDDPSTIMRADAGGALLIWVLVMWFSPKIAGALDVLLSQEERRALAARAGSPSISSSKPCTRSSCVRSSGSVTRSFSLACCSIVRSTGWGRSATTTRCP